ncbi:MAG: glycosyltransferase [Candidatus Melainabacteria bacterium]|nr:MAG: glycosyltransferase [Candidatus Melainabacteria bacterium]
MVSVVQISTFFSDHGGVEKSVSDLVSGLKREHDVHVLCTHNVVKTKREERDGVKVTAVGAPFGIQGRPLSATFPLELGRQECDVAHYHLPFPLAMASHILRAPRARLTVATWHHDLVRHARFNKMIQPLLESFLDKVDVIIVTAPALIDHTPVLAKRRHKCRVIPLGIEEGRFKEEGVNPSPDQIKYGADVLFVGRLVYYKGCNVLLDAISKVDATLALVGEGPLRADLEAQAAELGIAERVRFMGRVSDEELAKMYKASSIFVLPSIFATECFGLVQVEAMLNGKPVINTDLPTGVPWVSLHNETGLTVPPNDAEALAGAIKLLLNDSGLRQKLGAQAAHRAHQMFTLKHHVKAVSDLYSELLTN